MTVSSKTKQFRESLEALSREDLLEIIKAHNIRHVVLSGFWSAYIYGDAGSSESLFTVDADQPKSSENAKKIFASLIT